MQFFTTTTRGALTSAQQPYTRRHTQTHTDADTEIHTTNNRNCNYILQNALDTLCLK